MKLFKKVVSGCYECPGRISKLGGFCGQTIAGKHIENIYIIPDWCPLEDVATKCHHEYGTDGQHQNVYCKKCFEAHPECG